jgi:hypothetical protein
MPTCNDNDYHKPAQPSLVDNVSTSSMEHRQAICAVAASASESFSDTATETCHNSESVNNDVDFTKPSASPTERSGQRRRCRSRA